jgi:hypothetical protein
VAAWGEVARGGLIMDWIVTIFAGFVFALMLAPLVMLALTFLVLVPLAHLMPAPSMRAGARFDCPFSGRLVTATFVTSPDETHPTDVAACSRFGHGKVACGKQCLTLAAVGWTPSPMVPRFALLADGTAAR